VGVGKKVTPNSLKKKDQLGLAGGVPIQNGMLMPTQLGGLGLHSNGPFNHLDRQLRMSRFSFPGLEDEMLQQAAIADEGELANMESALGQGRRSSQFIGNQFWYQQPYYMNQNPILPQQTPVQGQGVGVNGNVSVNSLGPSSPMPGANHSPTFGTIQPTFSIDFTSELTQRRLSSGGNWSSAELQNRRISAADMTRLSASPLPPHQPGRGPEWEALFDAHAKVVSLDKSSPDYLTKKTAAWAEVYRAAELIEQRLQKR